MLVLLFVALWFILRGDLLYVFPCVILFLCFSVLLVLRLPRLGKRELILVLFVVLRANAASLSLPVVFLLAVPRRFLCGSSSLFVSLRFLMWRLWYPYLFLIPPSFGDPGRFCFVMVAFVWHLHLYFIRNPSILYNTEHFENKRI